MIDVIDGLESVRVASQDGSEDSPPVTIEFARPAPVLPQRPMRVTYRTAKQGGCREILGTPEYTHTTALPFGRWLHHYRVTNMTLAQAGSARP